MFHVFARVLMFCRHSRCSAAQFAVVSVCGVLLCVATLFAAQDQPVTQNDPASQSEQPAEETKKEDVVYVKMTTSKGEIILELNREKAPKSVENFMGYVDEEFYDDTIFHRVMEQFMIQGGGFTTEMKKKPTKTGVENEWENGLTNDRGTISMARLSGQPNSGTSQFFINVVDNPMLDRAQPDGAGYAVFGKVVAGMDVVDAIRRVPVQVSPLNRREVSYPTEMIVIEQVRALSAEDAQEAIEADKDVSAPKSQPEQQPSTTPGAGD